MLHTAILYYTSIRRSDPRYSLAGRTPKTVGSAMDAYALTNVVFERDEVLLHYYTTILLYSYTHIRLYYYATSYYTT